MAWILLVIGVGLAIALLVITIGLRRSVLILLAVLGIAVAGVVWYAETHRKHRPGLVPPEAVELTNTSVTLVYGGSYRLTARVRNTSLDHALSWFGLSVIASDCLRTEPQQCEVVGEQSKEIHILVPPGQSRDFAEQFQFDNMQPKGELRWDFRIDYTSAK
jgi:hypothetical protein